MAPKPDKPAGGNLLVDDPQEIARSLRLGQELIVQKEMAAEKHWASLAGWRENQYLLVDGPDFPVSTGSIFQNNVLLVRFLHLGRMFGFAAKVRAVVREPPLMVLSWPPSLEVVTLSQERRYAVDLAAHLTLNPDAAAQSAEGRLRDLSAHGCQVVVQPGDLPSPQAVAKGTRARVSLALPGQAEPVLLSAEVRNLLKREDKLVVGLLFDSGQEKVTGRIDLLLQQQLSLCLI